MEKLARTGNSIDWPSIKRIVQSGVSVDIQLNEVEMPVQYNVLMVLDEPIIFVQSREQISLPDIKYGSTVMVFVPTARDLCLFKARVEQMAEDGTYLALTPTTNAEFLRHRRSVRVKTRDDLSYRIQFAGKSSIYKGIAVQDIGRGGIGLIVYAAGPIPEKVQTEVRIVFPGTTGSVVAQGAVSHCVPYGGLPRTYRVGIKFTMISPTDQQIIAMYIDRALKLARPLS